MFETFIQTNSTKQNPFGSLNLNYQGEGISTWLLSSIAISIIFLTTIHNAHHQSGCNLQFWICHLRFINCNLQLSNCDLQFKNCNWQFTICKRNIFLEFSINCPIDSVPVIYLLTHAISYVGSPPESRVFLVWTAVGDSSSSSLSPLPSLIDFELLNRI